MKQNVKKLVKPVAQPVLQRVYARVDARVAERLDRLEAGLNELREQLGGFQSYVPVLLDNISAQNAAARAAHRSETELRRRIDQVEERTEMVRQELLFELRYGGHEKGGEFHVEPQVIDREKLDAAGDDIRLNLGCGHLPLDDYINVDGRALPGVDIVADVRHLPFEDGQVSEIFSAHVLEHFPVEELTRALLPYWHSVLRPGGVFRAVVPDAQAMIDEYKAGRMSFDDLRLVTFGGQEYAGDFHFTMFSRESIQHLLEQAGFVDVSIPVCGRRNGACYEMEVMAHRPGPGADAG